MHFSVLVNGIMSELFSNFPSLKQRDPLSLFCSFVPFLFVVVMKALSKILSTIVNGGFSLRLFCGD
jgi:hypothetical protein